MPALKRAMSYRQLLAWSAYYKLEAETQTQAQLTAEAQSKLTVRR